MAPEKTDIEEKDSAADTSVVSLDTTVEHEKEPYFAPVVTLPRVEVKTNEEEETELIKLPCKLFRLNTENTPSEWKERGTGYVKILHHVKNEKVRLLMRQEKTLKVRANHYITPFMELLPHCNSTQAFVWSVRSDFADEEIKKETFAIKFANTATAKEFSDEFVNAKGLAAIGVVKKKEETSKENETESAEKALSNLSIDSEKK